MTRRNLLKGAALIPQRIPAAGGLSPLNYHPREMYLWDTWYFVRGAEVHMIHLQKKRPGSRRPDADDGALGHAVTTDLINWQELPVALYPGPEGSIDDNELWTGCTYEHQGKYYLFYTARTRREKGRIQRTCVATSTDLLRWTKHPEPVILPDKRWYVDGDCRDLIIQPHPETGEFHGFYAAALPGKELVDTAAIAHVKSRDLMHWTHEPPVFAPKHHGVVEVPDVFQSGGKWWMTCLTGNGYGARSAFNDPYVTSGTIYAVADRLEGPYRELQDRVLIGSAESNGFSCRSVEWKGSRYLFYTQRERANKQDRGSATLGTLTTPKELKVTADGRLQARYSPLIEKRAGDTLFADPPASQLDEIVGWKWGTEGRWSVSGGVIAGESPKSWSTRACGPAAEAFMLTANVKLESGRAIGLLMRTVQSNPPFREPNSQALAVVLDYADQCVMFTRLKDLERLDARRTRLVLGRSYQLRVIAKGEFFEVYLDGVLMLNFVRYQPAKGRLGFFIEGGKGMFSRVRAVDLVV